MAEGFKPVGINAGKYYNSDPTSRISNYNTTALIPTIDECSVNIYPIHLSADILSVMKAYNSLCSFFVTLSKSIHRPANFYAVCYSLRRTSIKLHKFPT